MAFFFSVTTPFGIALGIALSKLYKENSPSALITVGLLNASSAGLLIYMALVDLLAADFMGPKLQGSIKLQVKSFMAVLLGAGGMSLMAKWAWNGSLVSRGRICQVSPVILLLKNCVSCTTFLKSWVCFFFFFPCHVILYWHGRR